jgi:hypothetical protein
VLRLPGTHPRSLICFASGVHATLLGSCLAACACAPGRSEGAFRAGVIVQPATRLPACSHVDVSGISQVSRRSILCLCLGPGPRPNQRFLAYLSVSSMLPPLRRQRRLQRVSYFGAIARLQHLLPTLQEWCCHHPCKARFRPAGLPLPGGSQTLWIALKGFRSHFHSPFLDLSWRYCDELPPLHSMTLSARTSNVSGILRPSTLAVFKLTTSSIFVVC